MFLCLGATPTVQRSMTFDRLVLDDVNRAVEVHEYASGKSPNVARVLKTLGADPLAVGFAGGDRGRFLLEDLSRAGVRHDFVPIRQQTRLCTTVIDRASGAATELVEEHAAVGAEDWVQIDLKLRDLLPKAQTWIFSGSLPAQAPQDFYARWIPLARERGARLIIDTRGEPLKLALAYPGFIAKLNRDELGATLGKSLESDADVVEASRKIAPPDGAAIVTLGAGGAIAVAAGKAWRLIAPKVKAISAVGSGDAFAAGMALGLARQMPLPQALRLGGACGAANALTALAGHLNPGQVDRLLEETSVTEIA